MSNLQLVQSQIMLAQSEFESNIEAQKLNLVFQKEAAFAMQIFQGNDYLTRMTPESIKNAIVNVSLTGISLNPVLKLAYLVPRKGKCVLDISYMGLTKILTDTGSVKNIEAKVVHSNEPFEIQQGTNPYIKHGIAPTGNKGDIIGVYSIATLNDGSTSVEWMYKQDIDAIAMRSESVKSGKQSPWHSDYPEMARKTVVKRHYKYLPKSERAIMAATAIDIDHENNGIDFESEGKKQTTKQVDLVDPNAPGIREYFSPLIDALSNERVPEDLFTQMGTTRVKFIEDFKAEFESGSLSTEKANAIYSRVQSYFQ